jgi:hypothetical protein
VVSHSATSPSTPGTTASPLVVAPPKGKGFVVIPGSGTPGVVQSPKLPAVPGPANDGSDFYGLGAAVVVIVVAIVAVRKLVPLRRQIVEGRHPTQPPSPPADNDQS